MRSIRSRTVAAAVTAIVVSGVSACGDSSDQSDGSADSRTFTAAWANTPEALDPNVVTSLPGVWASHAYMGTLLVPDTSEGLDQVIPIDALVPGLAESVEANADQTQYTLTLREGVMSQYGHELTADDVVYTFQRLAADPTSVGGGVLMPAGNVDIENPATKIDKYSLTYNLASPSVVALSLLAYPLFGILDSAEVESHATTDDPTANEWLSTHSASFGPYNVDSIESGTSLRMTASDTWYGEKPYFSQINLLGVPEGATRTQLLISGEVDMITEPPISQFQTIDSSDNATILQAPDTNRHGVFLNGQDPHLAKPGVRSAISHAINRDAIARSVYGGRATPALFPVSSTLADDQPNIGEYDVDLARQEMAAAGEADGFDLELSFSPGRPGPYAEDLARLIQSDLSQLDITVTLNPVPGIADFQAGVAGGGYQAFIYTERPAFPDAGYNMFYAVQSGSAANVVGFANAEIDSDVERAAQLGAGTEREALVQDALSILGQEVPLVFVVEVPSITGLSKSIDGLVPLSTGGFLFDQLARS